ncbi:hypothetical protein Kisp02_62480 [Kineosporia sp. NBRC 101731]|nr:hypothetical protein Kisp02_62480 [Kineosporia sp. NBRC 101731]
MSLLPGELAAAVGNLVDMAKDPKRPGPIYDRVMRRLAEPNVQRLCDWVGVPVVIEAIGAAADPDDVERILER